MSTRSALRWPLLNLIPAPWVVRGTWVAVAMLCGVALSVLPLELALLSLALIFLIVASLIEPTVALIAVLGIAPLKALTDTESAFVQQLPVDLGQIALAAMVGLWAVHAIATQRALRLRWSPIYLPLVILLLGAVLSLWNSVNTWSTLKELLAWLEMLGLAVIVVALIQRRRIHFGWIVAGLVAAGVAQALVGIYQFRGGSGAAHLWILDFRYFRAFGTFGQPNPFGAFISLMLCVALGALVGSASLAWRAYRDRARNALRSAVLLTVGYAAASGILGVGLLVSWSRGAWIGFGAAALTLLVMLPRRRMVGVGLVGLLIVGLGFALITGLAPQSLVTRISDFAQDFTGFSDVRGRPISDANFAVVERLAHWQVAIEMANEQPWTGVGFGAYEAAYGRYALMNWPLALGHAHNYYLNVLAETGLAGLIAYLLCWGIIVALSLKAIARTQGFERGVALGILAAWAHIAAHSFFDKVFVNNIFLHIGVMFGLVGWLLIQPPLSKTVMTDAE